MQKKLLVLLAVVSTCFATVTPPRLIHEKEISYTNTNFLDELTPTIVPLHETSLQLISPFDEIKSMLYRERDSLSLPVIEKVLTSLKCAREREVDHKNILTVIDYSLPSSEKRLWVFDLDKKELLFHTYVSHGIKSGTLLTRFFSNKFNSKASSIGVYTTEKSYNGHDGLSLRLQGLESGFNDNASNRSVVMHGGWYVEEDFIKKYGRAGRSWGCPAVPLNQTAAIINTIKGKSLFVIYYPNDHWFVKSKFLNCENMLAAQKPMDIRPDDPMLEEKNQREDVLFVGLSKRGRSAESDAVMCMPADSYARTFNSKPPLGRMLRRQINQTEYIALSQEEFIELASKNDTAILSEIYFAAPVVKYERGYNRTEMHIINLGKVKELHANGSNNFAVSFDTNRSVSLWSSNQFIRWLGL
jgi:hypothetical protein